MTAAALPHDDLGITQNFEHRRLRNARSIGNSSRAQPRFIELNDSPLPNSCQPLPDRKSRSLFDLLFLFDKGVGSRRRQDNQVIIIRILDLEGPIFVISTF